MHVTMLNDFIMVGVIGFTLGIGTGVLGTLSAMGKFTFKVRWNPNGK